MTYRSERLRLASLLVVLTLAGCGTGSPADSGAAGSPRAGMESFLRALASADVGTLCAYLSPSGTAALARDFGGSSCAQTALALISWIWRQPGEQDAVQGVVILPPLEVPLSPAPYRPGASTAALRLLIDDPTLGQRQAVDVTLRRAEGRWIVDGGANALFTLRRPVGPAPSLSPHPPFTRASAQHARRHGSPVRRP